jgi:type VI secretion system protein ImpA
LSVLDINALVAPVSDESPSGDNLEYEPEFGELDRAAQGTGEHVMGDEVVAAEEPDWSAVFEQAQTMLGRTKDLRVAVHLMRSAVNLQGTEGLSDGIALIRALLEQSWDTVHPQLDADDNDDPTFRVNSIMPLGDREGLLQDILKMTLVSSNAVGQFSLRDVRVAKGDLQALADQDSVPETALINAAFMDCDVDELQADATRIDKAREDIGAIEAIFAEKIGAANSPDVDGLVSDIKDLQRIYAENLNARGIGVEMPEGADGAPGGGAAPIAGDVNTREDAIRMIDKICTYYERNEPSSPVPMLLQRAKRLISKDFLDIMRDLTPDAVAQAELLGGIKADDGY